MENEHLTAAVDRDDVSSVNPLMWLLYILLAPVALFVPLVMFVVRNKPVAVAATLLLAAANYQTIMTAITGIPG